jgi:hypothetical protein
VTATSNPYGLRPVLHPSGVIRQREYLNGIASGYNTNVFTQTPVKATTDGTLIVTAAGADSTIGVFCGVEFSSAGKYFVLPYWPASQTYDSVGPMRVYLNSDKGIVYEAQADGSVAQTANFESINLVGSVSGSTNTGTSTQALNHTTTGASAGTFQVVDLAPYDYNAWGDAFTELRVIISTYQGTVA